MAVTYENLLRLASPAFMFSVRPFKQMFSFLQVKIMYPRKHALPNTNQD